MDQLFDFITNHMPLVTLWLALLAALLFYESRRGGKPVSPQQATHLINRDAAIVVDVRDRKAYNEGHVTGAVNIPYSQLEGRVGELEAHRDKTVILACAMGQHSSAAGKVLRKHGFNDVVRLAGGVNEWRSAGFPLVRSAQEKKGQSGNRKSGGKNKGQKGQAA